MSEQWTIKDLHHLSRFFRKYDLMQDTWHISPVGEDSIDIWFDCSDTFEWATADGESVLPSDLPDLEKAAADLVGVYEHSVVYFDILWAARKRKIKPMEVWLHLEAANPEVIALFTAVEESENE